MRNCRAEDASTTTWGYVMTAVGVLMASVAIIVGNAPFISGMVESLLPEFLGFSRMLWIGLTLLVLGLVISMGADEPEEPSE